MWKFPKCMQFSGVLPCVSVTIVYPDYQFMRNESQTTCDYHFHHGQSRAAAGGMISIEGLTIV